MGAQALKEEAFCRPVPISGSHLRSPEARGLVLESLGGGGVGWGGVGEIISSQPSLSQVYTRLRAQECSSILQQEKKTTNAFIPRILPLGPSMQTGPINGAMFMLGLCSCWEPQRTWSPSFPVQLQDCPGFCGLGGFRVHTYGKHTGKLLSD